MADKSRRRRRAYSARIGKRYTREAKYKWVCDVCGPREPGQGHDLRVHAKHEQDRSDAVHERNATYTRRNR